MKKTMCRTYLVSFLSGLILLAGCAVEQKPPVVDAAVPTSVQPEKTVTPPRIPDSKTPLAPPPIAKSPLNEGIDLYDKGDYNGAIKHLTGAADIWSADKATQISALKYIAFSYCVTGRQALCRQQFEKALKLDPAFDLAAGEKGHPLWAPSFERAKKAKK
jgi:hypothetical protein